MEKKRQPEESVKVDEKEYSSAEGGSQPCKILDSVLKRESPVSDWGGIRGGGSSIMNSSLQGGVSIVSFPYRWIKCACYQTLGRISYRQRGLHSWFPWTSGKCYRSVLIIMFSSPHGQWLRLSSRPLQISRVLTYPRGVLSWIWDPTEKLR